MACRRTGGSEGHGWRAWLQHRSAHSALTCHHALPGKVSPGAPRFATQPAPAPCVRPCLGTASSTPAPVTWYIVAGCMRRTASSSVSTPLSTAATALAAASPRSAHSCFERGRWVLLTSHTCLVIVQSITPHQQQRAPHADRPPTNTHVMSRGQQDGARASRAHDDRGGARATYRAAPLSVSAPALPRDPGAPACSTSSSLSASAASSSCGCVSSMWSPMARLELDPCTGKR